MNPISVQPLLSQGLFISSITPKTHSKLGEWLGSCLGDPSELLKRQASSQWSLRDGPASLSGACHSSYTHRNAQAHQTGFRCWECGGRLPWQAGSSWEYASVELGGSHLGRGAEEGLGECWEVLGGYGSGCVRECYGTLTGTGSWAIMDGNPSL